MPDVAPTIADAPATISDGDRSPPAPAPAPAQPPRILKKPAPLAPAPIDEVVPRNPFPPPRAVSHDDPTVVKPTPRGPAPVPVSSPPPIQTNADILPTRSFRPPPVTIADAPAGGGLRPRPASLPSIPEPASDDTVPLPRAARDFIPPAPHVDNATTQPVPAPPPMARLESRVDARMPAPPTRPAPSVAVAGAGASPALARPARTAPPPAVTPSVPSVPSVSSTRAPLTAPTASAVASPRVVVEVAHGLRWLVASIADSVVGAACAGGAAALALRAKGVRLAAQPIVDFCHTSPVVAAVVFLAVPLAAIALYQGLTVLVLGGTLGHRIMGLGVVRSGDGTRPGFLRTWFRAVLVAGGVIALFIGPLYGFFLDKHRRGVGDVFARTVVARRPRRDDR